MSIHQKRIFIGNLPPNIQQDEVEKQFTNYGDVLSVEIKQKKDNLNQDVSNVFAFVNIKTDERTLNDCFRKLSGYEWNGYQISLQLAKESFLERLKREREENNKSNESTKSVVPKEQTREPLVDKQYQPKVVKKNIKTYNSSSSESEDESTEECNDIPVKITPSKSEEKLDYIIKNNKFKTGSGKSLKIESFSDKPIHIINPKEKKKVLKDEKTLQAEEKRKKSLVLMKNAYNQQKSAIKSALSSIDLKKNNKIIFDDESCEHKKRKYDDFKDNSVQPVKKSKFSLFDEAEDHNDINFGIKKQFEGEHGQKLLQLQSRFTNDKRFTLDSRFTDDNETKEVHITEEDDEKQKQFEILESVLGKKITNHKPSDGIKDSQNRKTMTRFDPSKPEHFKYEIKESKETKVNKKKIKDKAKQEQLVQEPIIEVSKDTFYKVKDNLKQSLEEKQSFSLLSMFGKTDQKDEIEQEDTTEKINKTKYSESHNPFKYDSSDSEDETDNVKLSNDTEQTEQPATLIKRDNFFFNKQDERLSETNDFLKKLGMNVQPFGDKRRELKKIVRDKMKNNMRNHRPFRKKLGRSKMIKVKKAKNK